ncbi:hypothetical protein G3I40_16885, partial [Streptomyces sp. SID14478]|uniref:hypothetical protein n=1 Tax=Streptomyces sp. SID14478 TaxID=2706073 RepID=UPI0013D9FB16
MHHHRKRSHVSDGEGDAVGAEDVGRGVVPAGLDVDGEPWGEPALEEREFTGAAEPVPAPCDGCARCRAVGDAEGDAEALGGEERLGAGAPEDG